MHDRTEGKSLQIKTAGYATEDRCGGLGVGGYLLGLVLDLTHLAANEALDAEKGVFRVHHCLTLGNLHTRICTINVPTHTHKRSYAAAVDNVIPVQKEH